MSGSGDAEASAAGGLLYQESDAPLPVTVINEHEGESRRINATDGGSGAPLPVTVITETGGESRYVNATDGGSGAPLPVTVLNETDGKSRCINATDGGIFGGSGSNTMVDTVVASPMPISSTGTPLSTCDCHRSTAGRSTVVPRDSADQSIIADVAVKPSANRVEPSTIHVATRSSD
ncbi:unnamed protein product, partial [Laminaria digitata]